MDDATSAIYSAFLVEEEGTASTLRALLEVFCEQRLAVEPLHRPRQPLFLDAQGRRGGGQGAADPGRAGARRGSASSTLRPTRRRRAAAPSGCLGPCRIVCPRSSSWPGSATVDAANRFIRETYLPEHNARFARPPELEESAFVKLAEPSALAEILCLEEERVVARDNTVAYAGLRLQLPESRLRAHYVKARVKVRAIPG